MSLALAYSGIAACSSTTASHDGGFDGVPPVHDAPTDDSACALPVDANLPFGGCPATFDDTGWRAQACFIPPVVIEQVCTGYLSREFRLGGTHSWTCYYDPASRAFVAGQFNDDVDDLRDQCSNMRSTVVAGTIPAMGTCDPQKVLDDPCGTHDGAASTQDGGAD